MIKSLIVVCFCFFLSINVFSQTSNKELVELKEIIPDITLDIKYSTSENFVKQNLYSSDVCYLSLGMAKLLKKVQDTLKKYGYGLKIYDGYRPRSVQFLLWEIYPDSNFVADPKKGSRHNRGSAIDLTIIDYQTQKDLDMGTDYDFFGIEASHSYTKFNPVILKNREFLRDVITRVGKLEIYDTEWWHYNYKEGRNFPLKDFQTKN